ncbi:hypothetical protein DL93DRAFT_2100964 [Clavulina sp. PMI_390]|nr:hypothetical protein DL93DRAFT_2100964 [Clavulina sp. PMI_390]
MEHNLPPVPRVISGHNAKGQSTALFIGDIELDPMPLPSSKTPWQIGRVWTARETPANNDDQSPIAPVLNRERLPQNGSQAFIVDIPPEGKSATHRTSSLDYIILISGTLTCIFDTDRPDEGTTLSTPGSILVQRGTMHRWENRSSTEWLRIVSVMVGAKPVEIEVEKDGKMEKETLEEEFNFGR